VGYFERRSLECALGRARLRATAWERARWFFSVGYLLDRLARYLPLGALPRGLERLPGGPWLRARVVPINLFDSFAVIAQAAGERA
jgi:hypothetical protein